MTECDENGRAVVNNVSDVNGGTGMTRERKQSYVKGMRECCMM
jgi:hypothetical protein